MRKNNKIYWLVVVVLIFVIILMPACKKDTEIVTGFYNSMHFVREGGGQIEFTISSSDSSDKFDVVLTRLGARDSTIKIVLEVNDDNRSALSFLDKAMNQEIQINGDFKQSSLLAGTWAFIYMVTDKKKIEVTNTELRNSILELEQLIKDKFVSKI